MLTKTRKVKNAKDINTNELVYFKGHAKATYMSDGNTVEDTLDIVNKKINDIISDNTENCEPSKIDYSEKITYSDLKSLRDNNQLVPGKQYHITDYQCTTTESNTKSANNQFDIIVTADDESTLSHLAKATLHEGDTYFASCDLEAWQLWYDIDNDTNKYAWADSTNGKGVIYKMIDDKNNDCPYDFKNIMFYTNKYTSNTTSDKYYYTFSYVVNGILYDGTVKSQVKYCYDNIIKKYLNNLGKQCLNKNVFRNIYFGNSCCYNTFGNSCCYNAFGNDCNDNTLGNGCNNNTFIVINNCKFGPNLSNKTYNENLNNIIQTGDDVNTIITKNIEYYNDGHNSLVPVKHPDISTQPSILPYKLAGNYVYEQLIYIPNDSHITTQNGYVSFEIDAPKWEIEKPSIIKSVVISGNIETVNQMNVPCIVTNKGNKLKVSVSDILLADGEFNNLWLLIEYTSFSGLNMYYYNEGKENSDYLIQIGYFTGDNFQKVSFEPGAVIYIGDSYSRDISSQTDVFLTKNEISMINSGLTGRIKMSVYDPKMRLYINDNDFGEVNTSGVYAGSINGIAYYTHDIDYSYLSYRYNGVDTTRAWVDPTTLRFILR